MEYLVTDCTTLKETWIEAASAREALIKRENLWRLTPLPMTSKASHYSSGVVLDISLGQSAIRGRRENVTRGEGRTTATITA